LSRHQSKTWSTEFLEKRPTSTILEIRLTLSISNFKHFFSRTPTSRSKSTIGTHSNGSKTTRYNQIRYPCHFYPTPLAPKQMIHTPDHVGIVPKPNTNRR
jgi:hypothetical protein